MKLELTVDMMTSDDHKERFKAEYHQVLYRRNKLKKMLSDHAKGTLGFKLTCSIDLLTWQLKTMDEYVYILKRRAEIEGIEL